MQTKLTTAGQITLPINIRKELKLEEGCEVYFHIDPIEPLIWVSTNKPSDYSSKVLSKGQITIPKLIRYQLAFLPGETIMKFNFLEGKVNFERKTDETPCLFCNEKGNVIVEDETYPCLICLGRGQRRIESAMNKLSKLMAKSNRNLGIHLDTKDLAVPTIEFISSKYPLEYIERCQDYYQWLFFEEYIRVGISEKQAEDIIKLFKTEEYKTLIQQKVKHYKIR